MPSAVLQLCEKMQRFGLPYILPKVFEHFGVFFHIQSEHFVSIVQNPVRTEKFTKLVVGVDDLQPLAAGDQKLGDETGDIVVRDRLVGLYAHQIVDIAHDGIGNLFAVNVFVCKRARHADPKKSASLDGHTRIQRIPALAL